MNKIDVGEIEGKVSLKEYLKENGFLITSIGTMFGFSTVLGSVLQSILSSRAFPVSIILIFYIFIFLMILGGMLIYSELVYTFPQKIESRLRMFKYVLVTSYVLVIVVLSIIYRNLSHFVLPVLVTLMVTLPLSEYLFRRKSFALIVKYIKQKYPQKVFFVFALIVAIILATLSLFLTDSTNSLIDRMSQDIVQLK